MNVLRTIKDNIVPWKSTVAKDSSVKPVQQCLLAQLVIVLLLVGGFVAVMITLQQKHLIQDSRDKLEAVIYDLKENLETQSETLCVLEDVLLRDASLNGALNAQDRDRPLAIASCIKIVSCDTFFRLGLQVGKIQ